MLTLDVEIGEPVTRGALTLFPLLTRSGPADRGTAAGATGGDEPPYLPGPVAFERGLVDVTERDEDARVSELQATNRATVPTLLIEGEHILGAKQNRTLNVSVLVGAGRSVVIPVSCVEAGRWGAPVATRPARHHSPSSLRKFKTFSVGRSARAGRARLSDQGQVWEDVACYQMALSVDSPSSALEDVFEHRRADLDDTVGSVEPVEGQVGVVVAVGGRIEALDLFDRPETLAAFWDGLVRGYALDALHLSPEGEVLAEEVRAFLTEVAEADVERQPGVDLGTDLFLDAPTVTGVGLEWEGTLRHLAAFRLDPDERDGRKARVEREAQVGRTRRWTRRRRSTWDDGPACWFPSF
jgi:hypothetical protein